MKRVIGILALALAVLMVFSACGTAGGSKPATTEETTAAATTAPVSTAPPEPPAELTMMILGNPPADQTLVEDAVNKVVTPKINVKIKLLFVNMGAAMQQQNLMLSSNEKLDLMIAFPNTFVSIVNQNKVQEFGALVDKYGQGIKDALGAFYANGKVNGKLYGVNPITEGASGGGFNIVKAIVDKYKIDINAVEKYEDIGKVLKVIKDNEPKMYPFSPNGNGLGMVELPIGFYVDKLGDGYGVLMDNGKELKVVNLFEQKEYSDMLKLHRDWYLKGYIQQDAATMNEHWSERVKAGKAYMMVGPTKPGVAAQSTQEAGMEMVNREFAAPKTGTFTTWMWVIPNACKTPDKAVQMLNLMYTDAELENLLSWGIEGKHYEKKADGTIGFLAGMDRNNSGYFFNTPWMMGNQFLVHVWQGNPPDLWEQQKKFRDSAFKSKAMGFTYDPTPVKTEVAALSNVYTQYKLGLESGSVDPDKVLPQFLEKLKAAGIDKVIAEKQKQLDAWAAANGVK